MSIFKIIPIVVLPVLLISCNDNGTNSGQEQVVFSSTIAIDSDRDFAEIDDFISLASYSWNSLNEETVDFGLVLAYIRFEGTTNWHALPLSVPFDDDLVLLRYSFDIDNFDLIVEGEVSGNNNLNTELFDGDILRVIAIPPDLIIKSKTMDYTDYQAVANLYNLN